ncbi:hypothetical protein [Blochmannia endosymbiont of Camponotus nipponensis]|uniref:hypothetical protein n=1 Tax=Blochmannia endosymbiont of Camponotus nipponensis TaxID=2681986 RepID=UPI001F35BAB4|nr:hypothetical protein [Blochmannia endosymbiont of Camponotus nipponensis]
MNSEYFLRKKNCFLIIISIVTTITLASCSYRLHTDVTDQELKTIRNNIKSMVIHSYDPCGSITRAIISELYANHIDIFDDFNNDMCTEKTQIPHLYIINALEKHITTFLFQNGKEAGYQLILRIQTNLLIPNKDCCPIKICVCRSFIRNPEKALFNDTQEKNIRKEMYQEAAQQLIYQLILQYEN